MRDRTPEGAPPSDTGAWETAAVASVVQELLGTRVGPVRPFAAGVDHRVYAVGDDLVVRVPQASSEQDAEHARREAALLSCIAPLLPVTVPEVVALDPVTGIAVMSRVAGVPLLDAQLEGAQLVDDVASLFVVLESITQQVSDLELAEGDPFPLQSYVEEAESVFGDVRGALSRREVELVEAFLARPIPPGSPLCVLCHNDLGAEHLLVDPEVQRLTGVIDWADAAIVDPARDLGRLYRDLGPDVTATVVSSLPYRDDPHLWDRVQLHAGCALLEDIAYGIEHDERYVRAARANLERTLALG